MLKAGQTDTFVENGRHTPRLKGQSSCTQPNRRHCLCATQASREASKYTTERTSYSFEPSGFALLNRTHFVGLVVAEIRCP